MKPNIFISSTITDLHHLRDAVRDTIQELNYIPRMSEYGDLGYLPSKSASDSCYHAIKECQLFVLIIGKKYGKHDNGDVSVTHKEFRTAKELKLPIICLIDQGVNIYKEVFEANAKKKTQFPGMDKPDMTFSFINEFSNYSENNGYLTYNTIFDARNNLKNQLAHIFHDLLTKQFDPIRGEIKDVLAEISTLRHILTKGNEDISRVYAKVIRNLLNERYKLLKDVFEKTLGGIEFAVPIILKSSDFKSFLTQSNIEYLVSNEIEEIDFWGGKKNKLPKEYTSIQWMSLPIRTPEEISTLGGTNFLDVKLEEDKPESGYFALGKSHLWTNVNGDRTLNALFNKLKTEIN